MKVLEKKRDEKSKWKKKKKKKKKETKNEAIIIMKLINHTDHDADKGADGQTLGQVSLVLPRAIGVKVAEGEADHTQRLLGKVDDDVLLEGGLVG